jgi:hypothetical protein
MKNKTWQLGLLALALAVPGFVGAEEKVSIKEKENRAKTTTELSESLASMNEKCGTKAEISVNWASLKGVDQGGNSLSSYCEQPIKAATTLCETDGGKEGVQKGVKKIVCAYGGPGKRSITAKDGTINWKFDYEAGNNEDYAKEYLENNL